LIGGVFHPAHLPPPRMRLKAGNPNASTELFRTINFFAFQPLLDTHYSQTEVEVENVEVVVEVVEVTPVDEVVVAVVVVCF